ncbi:MAG: hypothetical protein K2X32_11480, partial [Phycisphaerales bacterium]|nr:hypothetical protein [Phycisphaerales bacterium]
AVRGAQRTMKESSDVNRAEENIEALAQQLKDLEAQFNADVEAATGKFDVATEQFEKLILKPKKTGISVRALMLVWAPHDTSGNPAY